jgi:hypothetical protein
MPLARQKDAMTPSTYSLGRLPLAIALVLFGLGQPALGDNGANCSNILAPGQTEVAFFSGSVSENQCEGTLPARWRLPARPRLRAKFARTVRRSKASRVRARSRRGRATSAWTFATARPTASRRAIGADAQGFICPLNAERQFPSVDLYRP